MDTLTLKALKPLRRWLPCTERLKRLVGERRQGLYVGFAILFLVVLAWCWVRAEARAAPPAAPQGPLQGWTLRFPAPVPDEDFSELERHQALGAPIFLPQGADFMLATHPAGLSGSLKVEDAERWDHAGGELAPQTAGGRFTGRAPQEPGRYRLAWTGDRPGETAALEVLVLARARSRENRLEVGGEVLGPYPDPATAPSESVRDHAERYRPPRLFALLDERSAALPVGPDLDLGQLVAFMEERAPDGRKVLTEKRHTQVLPVCAELYEKLSKLRERLRAQGVKVTRFYITSGFRTPAYNKQVGGAAFSRHCWGTRWIFASTRTAT
ncbi:MAG: D-Ala-D-Ala carboxypeptidase family metallohydrolase [Planctomycetota bacterium]|nr:D-Ala-D-Ala carboxypeptidase family metallohydrolase [Planctomycetota bacterium]